MVQASLLVVQILAVSGFLFERNWAAVLPGSTEGIYGFIAANYANGALQRAASACEQSPADTSAFLGVLELGGASFQVRRHRLSIPTIQTSRTFDF